MTGPCFTTVLPHRTRARRLLPFLTAIVLSASACTESTAPEPLAPAISAASARLHPYLPAKMGQTASGASFLRVGQSAQLVSLGVATASSSRVLLLSDADGNSTTTLANSIADAGFLVTVRPAPEYTWDGSNPSLDGFSLVIHLNGNTVGDGMTLSSGAQSALVDFVRAGGGFIGSQWSGYEASIGQGVMQDLVLTGFEGPFEENCFSCSMSYTQVLEQQSHPVLAGIPSSFSFMADGHASGALTPFTTDPSVVLMRVPSGAPGVVVRSLSAGKVVNFSFAPNYGLGGDGQTLSNPDILQLYINAVRWATGSSTQPPAKTPATLTLVDPAATYDGTVQAVSVATNPAGLGGVSVTYSQNGVPVPAPVNAGTYQVVATLTNEEYEAPQATGTLTIRRATPVIQWASPVTIIQGTPLGDTQLNASVTGVGGSAVAGEFVYLPAAGTVLDPGTHPLSVEFLSWNGNYTNVIKTVYITVSQPSSRLVFRGFYLPVHNMPVLNTVAAGRAIAVKFSVDGLGKSGAVLKGSPTSVSLECSAGRSEKRLEGNVEQLASHIRAEGRGQYTYVWKTNAEWAGKCRKLIVTLVDGSSHAALFRFEKEHKAVVPKKQKQEKVKPSKK
jgi:hypothetical protein